VITNVLFLRELICVPPVSLSLVVIWKAEKGAKIYLGSYAVV